MVSIKRFILKQENQWLLVLFVMAIIFLFLNLCNYNYGHKKEGLVTTMVGLEESYTIKQGSESYDDFYAEMFDSIVTPELCLQEVDAIIQNTQADNRSSVILDIGSQKGTTLLEWKRRGYENVYGIDKHSAMVKQTADEVSDHVICADVMERMNFERATFTHVLCLHQNLYDQPDLSIFFQNCRYWLKSGGILVLHLVQYQKKNPPIIIPIPKKNLEYSRTVEIVEKTVVIKETFTDKLTHHVRQQENHLQYQEMERVINAAVYYGFSIHGKIQLSSKIVPKGCKEFLYFFII